MIAVIDYGSGNLGSLIGALARHQVAFEVTGDAGAIANADAAIFPGDGAFPATMNALRERNLDGAIRQLIARGGAYLGICVGMQILFEASDEFAGSHGLGVFPGTIAKIVDAPRLPHMGWNTLQKTVDHPLVATLGPEEYAYFLHSYCAPVCNVTVATTTHGQTFSAIVAQDRTMGMQFHPEKSQTTGAALLGQFLQIARAA
ncbi:MAG: imidazole glycerol phosphate synthase subunit HisH [Vulcanimicrobiaceae bacterium]